MCGPEDPLFTPLLPLARVPFQAKESVHKTPFWENLEILASTASIFAQILVHKPPNLEIFSSQAPKFGNFPLTSPLFQRQMSVRKPHTSEIRATHPYLKKVECPPPPGVLYTVRPQFKKLHNTVKHMNLPTVCCVRKITQPVYNFTQFCTFLHRLCNFSYTTVCRFICFTVLCNFLNSGLTVLS